MKTHIPFHNWSLRRALDALPSQFEQSKLSILFTLLLFAFLKVLVVLFYSYQGEQYPQFYRGLIAFVFYLSAIKYLLWRPDKVRILAHVLLTTGLVLVWTSIFLMTMKLNLIMMQFVLMIILTGYYLLGTKWGTIYSVTVVLTVVTFIVGNGNIKGGDNYYTIELASPAFEILVVLNFFSLAIAQGLFYVAFKKSLMRKEELNEQLVQSTDRAERLAASRSNFLSTMSHELRTPLNSVVGIAELLMNDKPQPYQEEKLRILQSSAKDLLSLINNVLDYNKLDQSKMELEKVPVQIDSFMQQVLAGLEFRAAHKGLRMKLDLDPRLTGMVVASDPTRLSQIVYNLVGNSIKFTESGGIYISLQCTDITAEKITIAFRFSDTGIGIPASRQTRIFDQFTQVSSSTAHRYGGTGLGLSIVQKLLELFGSEISLQSDEGKGASFSFNITFQRTVGRVGVTPQQMNEDYSRYRVLVAEDNEVNKMIITEQLKRLNIHPVVVENGVEAVRAWQAEHFDLVFLDLHMPLKDGYEVIAEFNANEQRRRESYIIAFTASVTEQDRILEHGFDDFLYKPVSMDDLKAKLNRIAVVR